MRKIPILALIGGWWFLTLFPAQAIGVGDKLMQSENAQLDIARYARVRTWKGPYIKYTGGVSLQTPTVLVAADGIWTVTSSDGESSVNIGIEWDEPRNPRTVSFTYVDRASAPELGTEDFQIWAHPDGQLKGGESPCQGKWRSLAQVEGFSVVADDLTWTYMLPPINEGIYKLRVVLEGKQATRIGNIAAYGEARWKKTEFEVRFEPGREVVENLIEGYNAEVVKVTALDDVNAFRVEAFASDAPSESNDRAIFTVRAADRSFSFLMNDLEMDSEIFVKPLGVRVAKPGAKPVRERERETCITDRVREMPEQTFDGALSAVPAKHRNRFLSLSPPLNPRKFGVRSNGSVFHRGEPDRRYRFATGEEPDYERRERQYVEQDHFPILYGEWEQGDLHWRQGYVVTALEGEFDDPTAETVLVTRISAENRGSGDVPAKLWLCLRGKDGKCINIRFDNDVICEENRTRAVIEKKDWEMESKEGRLVFTATVPPGGTRSVEMIIAPSGEEISVPGISFDAARKQTIDYWKSKLAQGADFDVPDQRVNNIWKSLLIHQYCWGDYDAENDSYRPNVAAFAYGPVGNESSQMAKALDFFGHATLARNYYRDMWKVQGTNELRARTTDASRALPGWWSHYVFNTGFQLWNLCNHYRLTGDRDWLGEALPNMIAACNWLAEQRATTMALGGDGRPVMESGFFPPCGLEDEGRWFYWTMTNGYMYLGMRTVADLLTEMGHADAGRIAEEADNYWKDLRRGFGESIVRCPVVRLRDGSYVPYVPKHLHRRGRSEGFYEAELGALHLLTTNVYAPDSAEMESTLRFLEDAVFMTEAPSHDSIISFEEIEGDWFHLGGYGKTQPYLVHQQIAYLRRDEPRHFLRSFWNQLVAQNYRDINAFPEHICWNGGADCKTYEEAMWLQQFRSMLVCDQDGVLRLAAAAPREWFEDGKRISVRDAPTFFGSISYEIRSEIANGKITAWIDFSPRKEPAELRLRLRHPRMVEMKAVVVNGKSWSDFDPSKEVVSVPKGKGRTTVMVRY